VRTEAQKAADMTQDNSIPQPAVNPVEKTGAHSTATLPHSQGIASHALLWFGAAVSLAEIMAGMLLAPLGWAQGMAAIVIGHLIGCVPLFGVALIGARSGLGTMQATTLPFGSGGARLFASLNVVQLVGWTAVMVAAGAAAAQALLPVPDTLALPGSAAGGSWLWALAIGVLVAVWVLVGPDRLTGLSALAVGALFALTLLLCWLLFLGGLDVLGGVGAGAAVATAGDPGALSFGAAIELNVAMPLSWLPLIAD